MPSYAKLRRSARKNKAVLTTDPEGLLATLQITKRLVAEAIRSDSPLTVMEALETAIPMAAPKDPVRTWWSATRVLLRHTEADKSSQAILADAIGAQGKTNILQAKGIRA